MIFVDRKAKRDIQFKQQVERCYDDYCFYNRFDDNQRDEFMLNIKNNIDSLGFVIPYLPIYITTACSLNCEKCNNLMPLFHGNAYDFSWEKTRASMDIILSNLNELIFCELVGGEPFLNRNLETILDYVALQEKIKQIVIVTNGTIIPSERIIKKIKEYNVLVRVSDYGLFDKMTTFIAELDKYDVNVRVQQDMRWNDPGGIEKRGRSRDELKNQYNSCEFSLKCKYLCEDRLFTCARAASLYHLGKFDNMEDILIINRNTRRQDILDFYLHDEGRICDYCDLFTFEGKLIPAAVQVGNKVLRHSDYTVISNYELNHLKKMTKEYENFLNRS